MTWLHEISQSALAAAVLTLGLVILLELRAVVRLRQVVDGNLARVFEQLDLLRFENHQLLEAQTQMQAQTQTPAAVRVSSPASRPSVETTAAIPPAATSVMPATTRPVADASSNAGNAYRSAAALAADGVPAREIADRCGLAAGEARLLSSLAQARARRAVIAAA